MKPLVTVILPSHNRFHQMKAALTSIKNQTYEHKEIIIVLDGYEEQSDVFLTKQSKTDSSIHYILNEQPKGGAESRNIAIAASTGDYLAFLDDDDIWFENKLQLQVDFLQSNERYAIVGCAHQKHNGKSLSTFEPPRMELGAEDLKYENYLGSFSFCLVRKVDSQNIQIPSELTSCQDWYYWLCILEQSEKRAKVLPKVLVTYDSSPKNSLTNNTSGRINGYRIFYTLTKDRLTASQKAFHRYKEAKLEYISGKNKFSSYLKMLRNLVRSSYYIDIKLHLKEFFFIIK